MPKAALYDQMFLQQASMRQDFLKQPPITALPALPPQLHSRVLERKRKAPDHPKLTEAKKAPEPPVPTDDRKAPEVKKVLPPLTPARSSPRLQQQKPPPFKFV